MAYCEYYAHFCEVLDNVNLMEMQWIEEFTEDGEETVKRIIAEARADPDYIERPDHREQAEAEAEWFDSITDGLPPALMRNYEDEVFSDRWPGFAYSVEPWSDACDNATARTLVLSSDEDGSFSLEALEIFILRFIRRWRPDYIFSMTCSYGDNACAEAGSICGCSITITASNVTRHWTTATETLMNARAFGVQVYGNHRGLFNKEEA